MSSQAANGFGFNPLIGANTVDNGYMQLLQKAAAAFSKTRAGISNTKVAMFGDSTFLGSGSSGVALYPAGAREYGPCVKLASRLNQYSIPAVSHASFGDGASGASFFAWDPRFSAGAGWTIASLNNLWSVGSYLNSSTTNPLNFTPIGSVDTFVLYYAITSGGARSFTYAVDGGATTPVDCNAAQAIGVLTIPAGAAGTHTLNIARVTGGIYILGVRAYNSSIKCVEIMNMGRSGGRASNATSSNAAAWDALAAFPTWAPDLTIINLTINEWLNNGNLTTYKADMQTIINTAKATGDVILCTGVPSAIGSATTVTQNGVAEVVRTLARENNLLLVDNLSRFGTYEIRNPQGLYTDTAHPNGPGYANAIGPIYEILSGL